MQTLAVDAQNDLYLGPSGDVARATGLEAVMQAAEQAAQTLLGEMMYATGEGLPNFQAVWNGSPNLAQFEAYLRRALLAVAEVIEVPELETRTADNALSYRAVIRTSYGLVALNG